MLTCDPHPHRLGPGQVQLLERDQGVQGTQARHKGENAARQHSSQQLGCTQQQQAQQQGQRQFSAATQCSEQADTHTGVTAPLPGGKSLLTQNVNPGNALAAVEHSQWADVTRRVQGSTGPLAAWEWR